MRTSLRWLGLLGAVPFLVSSASARISIYPMPETLLPDNGVRMRTPFVARPGDILMTGRITQTEIAIAEEAIEVKVDKFTDTIAVGDELTPVIAPDSTTAVLGGNGKYYCGRDQRGRSVLRSALLGGIGAKFEAIVRFCFIDADNDHKFEQFFLAGAKDPAMQKPIDITPVAYHSLYNQQRNPGDVIRIKYRKFDARNMRVALDVEIMRNGVKQAFDYILWSKPTGTRLETLYPRMLTDPKRLPYPVVFSDLMGAAVSVDGVSPLGDATFTIKRNFQRTLFRPVSIQVNYVYIYI